MWFSNTVIKTFRLLGSQISDFYSDTLIIYWSQISLHPHVPATVPSIIGIGIWFWIHIDNKYQLRQLTNETFFTHWNVEETSSDRRAFLKGGVQFSTYATRLLLRLASGMPDVHMYVRPSQSLQAKEEWNEKAATASVASPPRQLQRYLKELTDEFKSTESNRSFERKELPEETLVERFEIYVHKTVEILGIMHHKSLIWKQWLQIFRIFLEIL